MEIKIRFNTEKEKINNELPAWRVLEDGVERLAHHVEVFVPSWTTFDKLPDGLEKWHITCRGQSVWDENTLKCVIR